MIPKFRFYSKRMNKIGIVISLKPLRKRVYVEWDDTLSGTEDIDDNGVLMQSTGLFDKNGKEIYEGDIVYAYSEGARLIGAIEYFDNAYCIKTKNGVYNSLWTNAEYYEIVGNAFENPELLEE